MSAYKKHPTNWLFSLPWVSVLCRRYHGHDDRYHGHDDDCRFGRCRKSWWCCLLILGGCSSDSSSRSPTHNNVSSCLIASIDDTVSKVSKVAQTSPQPVRQGLQVYCRALVKFIIGLFLPGFVAVKRYLGRCCRGSNAPPQSLGRLERLQRAPQKLAVTFKKEDYSEVTQCLLPKLDAVSNDCPALEKELSFFSIIGCFIPDFGAVKRYLGRCCRGPNAPRQSLGRLERLQRAPQKLAVTFKKDDYSEVKRCLLPEFEEVVEPTDVVRLKEVPDEAPVGRKRKSPWTSVLPPKPIRKAESFRKLKNKLPIPWYKDYTAHVLTGKMDLRTFINYRRRAEEALNPDLQDRTPRRWPSMEELKSSRRRRTAAYVPDWNDPMEIFRQRLLGWPGEQVSRNLVRSFEGATEEEVPIGVASVNDSDAQGCSLNQDSQSFEEDEEEEVPSGVASVDDSDAQGCSLNQDSQSFEEDEEEDAIYGIEFVEYSDDDSLT